MNSHQINQKSKKRSFPHLGFLINNKIPANWRKFSRNTNPIIRV